SVLHQRSSWWPIGIALGALLLGLLWFFARERRPAASRVIAPPVREVADSTRREAADRPATRTASIPELVVFFAPGSSTLRPETRQRLHEMAASLSANPDIRVKVAGYADSSGDSAQNLRLSENRARNVATELTRQGVAANHVDTEAYGDRSPVAD